MLLRLIFFLQSALVRVALELVVVLMAQIIKLHGMAVMIDVDFYLCVFACFPRLEAGEMDRVIGISGFEVSDCRLS